MLTKEIKNEMRERERGNEKCEQKRERIVLNVRTSSHVCQTDAKN
jgi:hypothetical protein